jgi:hypothetical protein
MFATGDTYTPSSGDDESGTGSGDNEKPPADSTSDHKSFWDWLFNRRGRDSSGRPAVPQNDSENQDQSN